MRSKLIPIGCLLFLLPAGCNMFHSNFFNNNNKNNAPSGSAEARPTAENLVNYINRESSKVQSLQVQNLAIEAKRGLGVVQSIELNGTMEAQGPSYFRLEGYLPGARTDMVDIGSNDREFWFWVGAGQGDQPLYHCSYTDLPHASLPLPIQPDWILEALGMAPIPPNPAIRLEFPRNSNTMELIEPTRSPKGAPITKVTVFNRNTVRGTQPQIVARKLIDGRGKLICMAEIKEMQQDQRSGVNVPHRIELVYPGDRAMEKISMSLVLDTIVVNAPIDPSQSFFVRPNKPGVYSVDLGRQSGPAMSSTGNGYNAPLTRGYGR
jgi:hypothetical protein